MANPYIPETTKLSTFSGAHMRQIPLKSTQRGGLFGNKERSPIRCAMPYEKWKKITVPQAINGSWSTQVPISNPRTFQQTPVSHTPNPLAQQFMVRNSFHLGVKGDVWGMRYPGYVGVPLDPTINSQPGSKQKDVQPPYAFASATCPQQHVNIGEVPSSPIVIYRSFITPINGRKMNG